MKPATAVLAFAFVAMTTNVPGATGKSAAVGPLTFASARVSLEGTSNIHAFTASTTMVRVTAVEIARAPEGDLLEHALEADALKAFEVVIPVATLTSPKEGIDKNMHKALKAVEHPEITFRLRRLQPVGGAYRAIGGLTVAGVEKEVTLDLQVERKGSALAVTGATDLLMTDFGVTPPKAMLGMLKTNPKVRIHLDVLIAPSLTSLT